MASSPSASTKDFDGARVGLLQFPGSNCDVDCQLAFRKYFGLELVTIWHQEAKLPQLDGLVIPGGFSYGDYLRGGTLAAHSPIMNQVKEFADRGGPILGICNGFQILTESHLIPGVLLRNQRREFVCDFVELTLGEGRSGYHESLKGKSLSIPVAHGEGRYYIDDDGLAKLKEKQQIVFQYTDPGINGSTDMIAGVCSESGNVLGMMPHPERATDKLLGSDDGLLVLQAFLSTFL